MQLCSNYANRNAAVFSTWAHPPTSIKLWNLKLYFTSQCSALPNTKYIINPNTQYTFQNIKYIFPNTKTPSSHDEIWSCSLQLDNRALHKHTFGKRVKWSFADLDPMWWRWTCFLGRTNRNWKMSNLRGNEILMSSTTRMSKIRETEILMWNIIEIMSNFKRDWNFNVKHNWNNVQC